MSGASPASRSALGSFLRFLMVGGVIGLVSTLAIWVAGQLVPLGTWAYGLVVLLVYLAGAVMAFIGHSRISFGVRTPITRFGNHLALSATMALVTAMLSAWFRSLLPASLLGMAITAGYRDAAAFVAAALASSVLSFGLSRAFVFSVPSPRRD
jgi:putative flippase GtrA